MEGAGPGDRIELPPDLETRLMGSVPRHPSSASSRLWAVHGPRDSRGFTEHGLPHRRHLHRQSGQAHRRGAEAREDDGVRSATECRESGNAVSPAEQVQGPELLVRARRWRSASHRSQDGIEPDALLRRSSRRRVCVGRAEEDRAASADWRRAARRGAGDGARDRRPSVCGTG